MSMTLVGRHQPEDSYVAAGAPLVFRPLFKPKRPSDGMVSNAEDDEASAGMGPVRRLLCGLMRPVRLARVNIQFWVGVRAPFFDSRCGSGVFSHARTSPHTPPHSLASGLLASWLQTYLSQAVPANAAHGSLTRRNRNSLPALEPTLLS